MARVCRVSEELGSVGCLLFLTCTPGFHSDAIMWRLKQFLHQDHGGSLEGKCIDVGTLKLQVRSTIAKGGFSCVYLVKDVLSGKSYALKHIICTDTEMLDLVRKEVGVMELLKGHPNIVTLHAQAVFDMGRTKECFLVMDHCEKNLVDVLDSRGAGYFEEKQLLIMFREVCNAVYAMHCQSPPIAHRDLKAENLLLGPDNVWVLCDFGSTTTTHKRFEKPDEMGVEEDVIRKHTTPAYRAPEMWDLFQREMISEKVDIWALGCLLYRMAYFTSAFTGDSKLQILNGNYRIPDLPHYSDAIAGLIKDMLALSPGARPDILSVWRRVNQHLPADLQKLEPDKPPHRSSKLPPSSRNVDGHSASRRPSASVPSGVLAAPSRKPPSPPKEVRPSGAKSMAAGSFWSSQFAQTAVGNTAGTASPRAASASSDRVPVSPQGAASSDRVPVSPQGAATSERTLVSPQPVANNPVRISASPQPVADPGRVPVSPLPVANPTSPSLFAQSNRLSLTPQPIPQSPRTPGGFQPGAKLQNIPVSPQRGYSPQTSSEGPQFDASPPRTQPSPPVRSKTLVDGNVSLSAFMGAGLNLFDETTNGGSQQPRVETRNHGKPPVTSHSTYQHDRLKSGVRIHIPYESSRPASAASVASGRVATSRRTVFSSSSPVSPFRTTRSDLQHGGGVGYPRQETPSTSSSASIWELQEGLSSPVLAESKAAAQGSVYSAPTDLRFAQLPPYDQRGWSGQVAGVDVAATKAKDDFLFEPSSQARYTNAERDTGLRRNDLFSSSERFSHRGSALDRRQEAVRRASASSSGYGGSWYSQQPSLGTASSTFGQTAGTSSSSSFSNVEPLNQRAENMQGRPKVQPAGWAGF